MLLLPTIDFSLGRGWLLVLFVKLILGKCLGDALRPGFLSYIKIQT